MATLLPPEPDPTDSMGQGIDRFDDDTSPPINLDDLNLSLGDDLSDQATTPTDPSEFDGGETLAGQGIDLFGDASPEEPGPTSPVTEGIGLFEDSPLG